MSARFHSFLCGRIAAEWLIIMKGKKIFVCFVCAIGVLVLAAAGLKLQADPVPTASMEVIANQLDRLGAQDALFLGEENYLCPGGEPFAGESYLLYHSDDTGLNYCFDPSLGVLERIENPVEPEYPNPANPNAVFPESTHQQRHDTVLELGRACLGPNRRGDLEITKESYNGSFYLCILTEMDAGEETGASVMVQCMPDGTILSCIPRAETVVKTRAEKIGEQAAIDAAYEALREQLGTQIVTEEECALKANGAVQYYLVTLTVQTKPVAIVYYAEIDAVTGEALDIYWT